MTCDDQYDAYGKTPIGKNSYWIFQAVKGMHAKFNELNRQLTKETLISGLQIGQMVTDFQGNQDDPGDVLGWLSAAASMGGAIGGLVPGAVSLPNSDEPVRFSVPLLTHCHNRELPLLVASVCSAASSLASPPPTVPTR